MRIYHLAIAFAVGAVVYLYGVMFDELSEEQLIAYTPLWFLSLIFGCHGMVAGKLMFRLEQGRGKDLRQAFLEFCNAFGALRPLGWIVFFPLLFIRGESALGLALTATLIWAIPLFIFLQVFFPRF